MNGKKAKRLRRLARKIITDHPGTKVAAAGEGKVYRTLKKVSQEMAHG